MNQSKNYIYLIKRQIIPIFVLLFVFNKQNFAQCIRTFQWPLITVNINGGDPVQIAPDSWTFNDFSLISGITSGSTYTISCFFVNNSSQKYVTITDVSNNILAHGMSPYTWTSTLTGNIRIHWSDNNICNGVSQDHITTIQCISCDADNDNYSVFQGDCNDNAASINPGATEICDMIDNDCDGITDENCPILSAHSGNWENSATWVGGIVPSASDNIIIQSTHNVSLSSSATVNGLLTVNGFLNLSSDINGAGQKVFNPGSILNLNLGSLTGSGEWIINNGAILNINGGAFGDYTPIHNHGVVNWQSGFINEMGPFSCYYNVSPPAYFINEIDGIFNLNSVTDVHLGRTTFTNHGILNKNNTTEFTFHNGCSGSTFENSNSGVLNHNAGKIIFTSGTTILAGTVNLNGIMDISSPLATINGSISNNSVLNLNTTTAFKSGGTITGLGTINNTGYINFEVDYSLSSPIINNTGNIGGIGTKTYSSMTTLNNTNGSLSGGSHIISNGAIVNLNGGTFGEYTQINNNGTVNWESGFINEMGPFSCYYNVSPQAIFTNEEDGVFNINASSDVHLGRTNFTNHGILNKNNTTEFTFHNGCSGSPFTNSSTGVVKGNGSILFLSGSTFVSGGSVNPGSSPGVLSFNNSINFNGTEYNCEINGTTVNTEYDQLNTAGEANLSLMTLNVEWGNFLPAVGQSFAIMTFGSRVGEFATVNIQSLGNLNFEVQYNSNNVTIVVAQTYYLDFDQDGYGNIEEDSIDVIQPVGYVSNGLDCNDNNDDEFPGQVWYIDLDSDNFGGNTISQCVRPLFGKLLSELLESSSGVDDCNDNNASINPNGQEACNETDDDCDGMIDEGTLHTFYQDADGDSYGNIQIDTVACQTPLNFVFNSDDCNDTEQDINPAAQEICNGIDDDCDNLIDGNDESAIGTATWYADIDGDGYGDPNNFIILCSSPGGNFVNNYQDCNDGDPNFNPDASEVCNEIDDDCDDLIDEEVQNVYYADADIDGFGNANDSTLACSLPLGYIGNKLDCNDEVNTMNPLSNEVCDDLDNDCDGGIDEVCGCMEETAHNYNPLALFDDGSCETCSDGIKNGDELGVDCGGSNPACSICPPPVASCYTSTVNIYVNASNLIYNGAGAADVYLVPASFLNNNSSGSGNFTIDVARLSFPVSSSSSSSSVFNWTTYGACEDAAPGSGINDNDKGYSWKSCLPVTPADFNKIRNYKLRIIDDYGTSMCMTGKYKIIFTSGGTNPNIISSQENDLISMDQNESMLVYPNPGADHITIELNVDFKELEDYSIHFYDAFGKKIKSFDNIQSSLLNIETSDLLAGAYNLILKSAKGFESKIWIKM